MKKKTMAVLLCTLLCGASAQAALVRSASAEIHGTFQYDFDAGTEVMFNGADVHWNQYTETTRGLTVGLGSSAKLLSLGSVDFNTITEGMLMGYTYGSASLPGPPDPGSLLEVGDVFAVLTDEGNYAKAIVTGFDNGSPDRPFYDLHIRYALYDGVTTEVPEPGALGLVALGLGGLAWTRRRKVGHPPALRYAAAAPRFPLL